MTHRATTPDERLSCMRKACEEIVHSDAADMEVTMAALTYRRIMNDDSRTAEQIIEQVKRAVAEMRLEAHALPDGSTEQAIRQMITAVGQTLIDSAATSVPC